MLTQRSRLSKRHCWVIYACHNTAGHELLTTPPGTLTPDTAEEATTLIPSLKMDEDELQLILDELNKMRKLTRLEMSWAWETDSSDRGSTSIVLRLFDYRKPRPDS